MERKINSEKAFHRFAFVILLILAVICIMPILLIVIASLQMSTLCWGMDTVFFRLS